MQSFLDSVFYQKYLQQINIFKIEYIYKLDGVYDNFEFDAKTFNIFL